MPNAHNALESKIKRFKKKLRKKGENKMEAKEIAEQLRQDWLKNPNLTETELEYLNNYYYTDHTYCEECDKIVPNSDCFWYDDDEYTDYLHIDCNKEKYSEQ